MSLLEAGLILVAAVAAGAMNAVVGAGTLITFPTLLALGVPPILANVSNTVGLVAGSVAGASGYRATPKGHLRLVLRLVAASTSGGIAGALLLLALPSATFALIVPVLLVVSAILAAVQPRVARAVARRRGPSRRRRPGHRQHLCTMCVAADRCLRDRDLRRLLRCRTGRHPARVAGDVRRRQPQRRQRHLVAAIWQIAKLSQ